MPRKASDNEPSDFARRALAIISKIPPGRTMSYGEVAERAGHRGAARAVVALLKKNSKTLGLPWHRVVGHDGSVRLKGEAGKLQRRLLRAEQSAS